MGILTIRVNDDLAGRVEAVSGKRGRSKFIRDAIEEKLGGSKVKCRTPKVNPEPSKVVSDPVAEVREKVAAVKPKEKTVVGPAPGRWDADKLAVVAELRKGPGLVRKLSERLGWVPGRVEKVCEMLIAEGAVKASGGLLECVDV